MSSEAHFDFARDRTLYESLFDPGTRMPRRRVLLDRLGQALACERGEPTVASAILLFSEIADIDRPGSIADLGDVARALRASVRGDETVARGPDSSTLMVVCNMVDSKEHAQLVAERLQKASGIECHVDLTVSNLADDPETLLARAVDRGHGPGPMTAQLMAAMQLVDEIIAYRAQLHATTDPKRRAQLETAMETRAAAIKAYLDAQDDT